MPVAAITIAAAPGLRRAVYRLSPIARDSDTALPLHLATSLG